MQLNTLGMVHDFLKQTVRPGSFCIDATAGKGRDTALLCRLAGPEGRWGPVCLRLQGIRCLSGKA